MTDTDDEAIMRLAGRLVLAQVTIGRFGFDLIDALVMLTIAQANVEPISRDGQLQRQYATYDQAPPDALRRPISINAVAQSLGIPFETVRRRVTKLSVLGQFRSTKAGIVAPTPVVMNRPHRTNLELAYGRLRELHDELDRRGLGETYAQDALWSDEPPLRLAARVSGDYLLRLVHLLMNETGDVLSATVWLAVFCDNVAVGDRGPERAISGAQKPLSMAALARRLRLSTETTRRRLQGLVAEGLCVQLGATVVVDAGVLARPGVQAVLSRNRQDVRRLFTTLADYGVPQAWRAAATGAAASAAA